MSCAEEFGDLRGVPFGFQEGGHMPKGSGSFPDPRDEEDRRRHYGGRQ